MRSWFEQWGSWQFEQLSLTGACTHRNGPRLSAWQWKHVALGVGSFSSAGAIVPCGLWQDVHVILPSRSGMWELRSVWPFCLVWHWPHVSMTVSRASWAVAVVFSMIRWQFVHATSRDSWLLPFQNRCGPLLWHDVHTALRVATGVLSFLANVIIPPTPLPPPALACASPGP